MRLFRQRRRSIPACTGDRAHAGVYPRVYGETIYGTICMTLADALEGSIPACTGKPLKGFVLFCSPFACGDPLEIPSVPTSQTEGLVVLHQVDTVGIHDVFRRFAKCTYTLFAHGRRVSPSHDYRALP